MDNQINLPKEFVERMQKQLGSAFDAFMDSFSQEKYQALRLNAFKYRKGGMSAAQYLAPGEENTDAQHFACKLTRVPWAKDGYYYEREDTPGKHPYHEAGLYYIQEPSAMAPVGLLAIRPGQKVLDLCAAPGGKSTQIAALLGRSGGDTLLVSNEIHPARAKILSENIERMGISHACVTNETPERLADVFVSYFDRILIDAPCSGEGMFRKNPQACEEWSPDHVKQCGERQDEIFERAAGMLKPGGRIVYSTCTFAPTENEGSVSRFLLRHPEFRLVAIDKARQGYLADAVSASDTVLDGVSYEEVDAVPGIEGTLRLWPHAVHGEGHFVAVLQKKDDTDHLSVDGEGGEEGVSFEILCKQKEMTDFVTFCEDTLQMKELLQKEDGLSFGVDRKFLRFGEQLYLAPRCLPSLKGLKVLRPGLHIGTLKKNRFEPSHALALALTPDQVRHHMELVKEPCQGLLETDETVCAYLKGQTFPAKGEKGWYLICVDGFSLGWGKLAGGIMKNHYPKGLRK